MTTKLEQLMAMKEEYQKKVRAEGQGLLTEMFKEFFEQNAGVDSLSWQQYTPYFNDGDPCTFRVTDVTLKFADINSARENLDDSCFLKETYGPGKTPNRWGGYDSVLVKTEPSSDEEVLNGGGDYEDGYYDAWNLKDNTTLRNNLDKVSKLLSASEDVLEMVLGDHVKVVVTKDSIDTEEYNHD
jgi:hypothetical protein